METLRESTAAPDADPDADLQQSAAGPLKQSDIVGLKYFDQLHPLLERLRDDGCLRDRAGNRELHYDQYCLLVLLYLFNPTCSSLRAIQQASELQNVQKRLGCARASLGSLSEAATVFDPERLIEIIRELGGQLQPLSKDSRLKDITHTLTLVDATIISAMPRIMTASVLKRQTGKGMIKWRLHTHFEVDRHQPSRIDVTRDGGGDNDERAVLERTIDADQTYCAIIACLLIALWTGRKPTKRTQEMLCYFLTGWATADEVAAHVAKLKEADEQAAKTN